jgi:hypothetical protein
MLNLPLDNACRSQASIARTIGLRGNAIVTEVSRSILVVAVAATVIVKIESWDNSPHDK